MAITIPTTEPTELRAGDSWQWRREDLADYPASAWLLTYYFRNATSYFDIVAAADGDKYAISVAKSVSLTKAPGVYPWVAVLSNATERHEVGRGTVAVLPDFASEHGIDTRSFARRLLDMVELALLNRATSDQLDVIETTLGDRGLKRSEGGLFALRTQLKTEVRLEDAAEARRLGRPSRSRLLIRFNNG